MSTATFGLNVVDWEERVVPERLRSGRLSRLECQLESSDLGAVLGIGAMDNLIPFALLARAGKPVLVDVGSAPDTMTSTPHGWSTALPSRPAMPFARTAGRPGIRADR